MPSATLAFSLLGDGLNGESREQKEGVSTSVLPDGGDDDLAANGY